MTTLFSECYCGTPKAPSERARIWSITASDCSAGAGMQADVSMAQAMGVDCATLVIAITAQSSRGVQAVEPVTQSMLDAQWVALQDDGWPQAVRLGWIPPDPELFRWLLQRLQLLKQRGVPIIWDPVLGATGGGLASWHCLDEYAGLLKLTDVITPNVTELLRLTGDSDIHRQGIFTAAQTLLAAGAGAVLVTGITALQLDLKSDEGQHCRQGENILVDWYIGPDSEQEAAAGIDIQALDPEQRLAPSFMLMHYRLPWSAHGTGCHLAAALAAGLASGLRRYDSVVLAVANTLASLAASSQRASGYHQLHAADVRQLAFAQLGLELLPLTSSASLTSDRMFFSRTFPALPHSLGLYGLVDNLAHLRRLLKLGIDSLQWRVKNPGPDYRDETWEAIRLCRHAGVPLFINDDWQLALELKADGVHLGQEDLLEADLVALSEAGLMLGISTHSEWEILHALRYQPSYIAFGPVFKPLSKTLKYPPLGCDTLSRWVRRSDAVALTCIGGITTETIQPVAASGIRSAAIVTALADDDGLEDRLQQLQCWFPPRRERFGEGVETLKIRKSQHLSPRICTICKH
ncbi:thiamine phosphate synthase [Oceanobacter sp. 5_MG-2023]|uniref:thiamine phosphate synthase n=1 Tax=Oceanobacter sp. 5_MG-2023 TaxID=3062645 RepID=UPI0026E1ED59|nr:thiamine phosphate synthase [Oceanobacter sp. 5_MG-2023]MDO6681471.1 thiamine phosphate synthase [Oceanobacter sp. 5_MG-2023]